LVSLRRASAGRDSHWRRGAVPARLPDVKSAVEIRDGAALNEFVAEAAHARDAGIEVLTLDARGDNANALHLYRTLGFREFGRLPDFVAVGDRRYDKVFYMLDFRS
jgi:hypothetical protein